MYYYICLFDNQPHGGANLLLNAVIVIQTRLATSLITQTRIPGKNIVLKGWKVPFILKRSLRLLVKNFKAFPYLL